MKWAIGALAILQSAAASLRYLTIGQNNGYKLPICARTFSFFVLNALLCIPIISAALFLGEEPVDVVIKILVSVTVMLIIFYKEKNFRTQPKFTERAKIVYSINVALLSIFIIFSAAIFEGKTSIIVISCENALSVIFAIIAMAVTNPYFNKKNRKFIEKNCEKLRDGNAIKIGITGSYGKSSCKNILREMLSRKYLVIATEKNYNTPMGIALTVEKMTMREEIFIAEMGARRRGDIDELCELVRPDYSITTGVCPQHLSTFKSLHNIYLEKSALGKNTKFTSVYNGNDKYAFKMYKEHSGRKLKVCCNKTGDVYAENIRMSSAGSDFMLCFGNVKTEAHTRLLGKHNIINIALCAALAYELGVDIKVITEVISELKPTPHRLEYSFANGIHILDDSYNSNVVGVKSALDVMESFGGRKVVLAQGIVECGRHKKEINSALGEEIAAHADVVILCGRNAKAILEGLKKGNFTGKLFRFSSLKNAQKQFKNILKQGDVLLLQNDLPDTY